ncbi:hypothetical protein PTNB73_07723 [Pyrenophora teres f. teres]|nr:hypothetical protein HRS9122_06973 [Pyrenophora teres f. teres]KAE8860113.1 hypothetical protein PTNB73_07723 [Pyrenophora teres f. teres]
MPTAHGTGAAQRQPGFAADAVSAAMVLRFYMAVLVTLIAVGNPPPSLMAPRPGGQEMDGQEMDGQEMDGQEMDGQEMDGQDGWTGSSGQTSKESYTRSTQRPRHNCAQAGL